VIIAIIIATILSVFNMAAGGDLQPAVRGEQISPPLPATPSYAYCPEEV